MARLWTPTFVQQREDFPQDRFPQKDVDPGVQDLVPCGHADHHQKTDRRWLVFSSDAQYDNVNLQSGPQNIVNSVSVNTWGFVED